MTGRRDPSLVEVLVSVVNVWEAQTCQVPHHSAITEVRIPDSQMLPWVLRSCSAMQAACQLEQKGHQMLVSRHICLAVVLLLRLKSQGKPIWRGACISTGVSGQHTFPPLVVDKVRQPTSHCTASSIPCAERTLPAPGSSQQLQRPPARGRPVNRLSVHLHTNITD